jgi:hypothetical protein
MSATATEKLFDVAPELADLLADALEMMEGMNSNLERDAFELECGNCDAGIPMAHSFGCNVKNALRKAGVR